MICHYLRRRIAHSRIIVLLRNIIKEPGTASTGDRSIQKAWNNHSAKTFLSDVEATDSDSPTHIMQTIICLVFVYRGQTNNMSSSSHRSLPLALMTTTLLPAPRLSSRDRIPLRKFTAYRCTRARAENCRCSLFTCALHITPSRHVVVVLQCRCVAVSLTVYACHSAHRW